MNIIYNGEIYLKRGPEIIDPRNSIEYQELEREMEAPDFWDNPERSQKMMKELSTLKEDIQIYQKLETQKEEIELKAVILEALAEKPDGHAFGGSLEKQKEDKTEKLCMAQIGG